MTETWRDELPEPVLLLRPGDFEDIVRRSRRHRAATQRRLLVVAAVCALTGMLAADRATTDLTPTNGLEMVPSPSVPDVPDPPVAAPPHTAPGSGFSPPGGPVVATGAADAGDAGRPDPRDRRVPAAAAEDAALPELSVPVPLWRLTVSVTDDTGTVPVYDLETVVAMDAPRRLAVASEGWNDPGSGEGRVWIDDLEVERADGSRTSNAFDEEPSITESTTGADHEALWYDGAARRLVAVADSANEGVNYQSIAIGGGAPVTRVRFRFSRTTGETGDGSFWSLYFGLVPGDRQAVVRPRCSCGVRQMVKDLVGLAVLGDGDAKRLSMGGTVDRWVHEGAQPLLVKATYRVEIGLVPLR
jgi:hypothetical protein